MSRMQPRSSLRPRSGTRDRRRVVAAFVLMVTASAGPVLGEPAAPASGQDRCWSPGAAPALFGWTASPGIACRDAGAVDGTAGASAPPAAAADLLQGGHGAGSGPSRTGTQITFSGTAYFGIGIAF